MIKNDFIQLILQLDASHKEAANTGSEYITIDKFIVRISDHFTIKTSTHDLDVIFLNDDNYIIYPTKAMFKKPQHCTTAEEGIEYIKGWLKWGAPYVKGPNDVAGTDLKFKTVETTTIEETITVEPEVECTEDNSSINPNKIMIELGWVESKKHLKKLKWRTLNAAVKSVVENFNKDDEEDLLSILKACKNQSVEQRVYWIKNTFGISDDDIKKYMVLYNITYDKIRIIQQNTLDYS